ncbi:hypothetical protein MKX03_022650, partial [Papaver bracteatum]
MASPPRNGDSQGIEKAKLVGMVLNKEEKINEEGITDHVTFIFEDETDKIDCHMRLCDVKEMAEIENEMYAEIHVNMKDFQSTNQLEAFSMRR